MAQINGSFSGYSTSIYKPYIVYSYTQSISNNESYVDWELFFAKYNASYFAFNTGGFPCTISVNGTVFNGDETFDLRSGSVPEIESIRSGTRTVAHNSDGTKSIYIGASGDTETAVGTFNFGSTIALATIPREAYITNSSVNFTVENAVALTLSNAGNMYVKIELYVNGNLIATRNAGQVSSYNFDPDSGEDADIYAEMPSSTSTSMYFRVKTYSDSGYTTQIGSNKDKAGTVSINTTTNKPTFTDWAVANVDKTVDNVDKYANTLVSSSTETLLGGTNKVIKGYSKVRATVSTANKAVALNSATMVKYRFVAGALNKEENYSGVADVTLDIDNVLVKDFSVTATDSRNLSTTVNKSLANLAEYTPPVLTSIQLIRDNGVDSETRLVVAGSYWKQYFGGGTNGVQNTITAHWRYKETTEAWASQTWESLTLTDTSGALSFDDYIEGDLGASGFDPDKSFDIEVRIYDKLSNTILEETLSVGTPVMHFTKNGVAIKARYDSELGGALQVAGVRIDGSTPTGVILPYGGTSAPDGYLMCDGSAVSRETYATLFGVVSTAFGVGDGSTTFNVPDMRTRLPRGRETVGTAGATGGADTIDLQHSHTVNSHTHTLNSHSHGVGSYWATVTGGTGAVYFDEDGTTASWTANMRVTGTYSTSSYSVSGGADVEGTSSTNNDNSGTASPATNNALSTTQNIQNKYIDLNYIIKI